MRSALLVVLGLVSAGGLGAQGPSQPPAGANDPGRRAFELRCGRCHGGDGKGGEMGPNITARLAGFHADAELTSLIHTGIPATAMPPTAIDGQELAALIRFLHSIEARPAAGAIPPQEKITVET